MLITSENYLEVYRLIKEHERYNKIEQFIPYPYQKRFADASKHYRQRFMRAGNRTGKTYGAAMEFAQHITGLYQPWFEGEKIKGTGHTFWCIGVDLDQTAKVMQKELFGSSDIRLTDDLGTGTIPRHCIDFDSFVKDGNRLISCRIKHTSGGTNTIHFYGALSGQSRLMG